MYDVIEVMIHERKLDLTIFNLGYLHPLNKTYISNMDFASMFD